MKPLRAVMFETDRLKRQTGVTLIEVMISMLLVGILLVATTSLWAVVAQQFDDLTLRQQAVLRIDGEMARLVDLYSDSGVALSTETVTDYTSAAPSSSASYLSTPASRLIHSTGGAGQVYVRPFATAADFRATLAADGANAGQIYTVIYYFDAGASGTAADDRNLVWLDRDRNVVGQLSWALTTVTDTGGTARDCGTLDCAILTLFLDYPYRFSVATDPLATALAEIPGSPVETITLQTIVGHRR